MKKQHVLTLAVLALAAVIATGCDSGGDSGSGGIFGASCKVTSQAKAQAQTSPVIKHLVYAKTAGPVTHRPRALDKMSDQGKFSESQELPITVSLQLNNVADLENRLLEMYTPGTAGFGKFLTPDEFKARYAPTGDQVAKVQAYLASNGVQDVQVNPNGYLVSGKASVKSLNAMFQTEIDQYKDDQGKSYFAPRTEPVLPKDLGIEAVHGIHNLSVRHAHSRPLSDSANPRQGTGHNGSGHSGGLSASDIRGAYNLNIPGLDGTGQTLALFELDAYNQSDLTAYETYNNLPNVSVTPIDVNRGSTSSPGGGQAEVTLDIELMMAVAPGAKILVYEGANSDAGILATYSKIANDNLAKSVSTSWGTSEDQTSSSLIKSENTVFMQMAAQGQSIFSAAGDAGANDNGSSLSIDDPSGQPYMTAVGGTLLDSNGPSYVSETTWTSGGGGVSSVWTIPDYQKGLDMSVNKGSTSMRNIPDVSLESDMSAGYDIYQAGQWGTWGGTSCAAPIWAAFTALVNQKRGSPIGFINPWLYAIGVSKNYSADFHDIADGSTNGYYPAVSGFDDATGWGSMNGANLLNDLSSLPGGC